MSTNDLMKHFRAAIWDMQGAKEAQCERVLRYLSSRNSRGVKCQRRVVTERTAYTFIEAKAEGLIYKSKDELSWVFDATRYESSTAALAALNATLAN